MRLAMHPSSPKCPFQIVESFELCERWAWSVGILDRFAAMPRAGRQKAWCCDSCRMAAARHRHPEAGLGGVEPAGQKAPAGSRLGLANETPGLSSPLSTSPAASL